MNDKQKLVLVAYLVVCIAIIAYEHFGRRFFVPSHAIGMMIVWLIPFTIVYFLFGGLINFHTSHTSGASQLEKKLKPTQEANQRQASERGPALSLLWPMFTNESEVKMWTKICAGITILFFIYFFHRDMSSFFNGDIDYDQLKKYIIFSMMLPVFSLWMLSGSVIPFVLNAILFLAISLINMLDGFNPSSVVFLLPVLLCAHGVRGSIALKWLGKGSEEKPAGDGA